MSVRCWLSDIRFDIRMGIEKVTIYGMKIYQIYYREQIVNHGCLVVYREISIDDLGNIRDLDEFIRGIKTDLMASMAHKEERVKKLTELIDLVVNHFENVKIID